MAKFKTGDTVTVLDDSFSGKVKGYKKDRVVVTTTDGFELEFSEGELVKTQTGDMQALFNGHSVTSILREKQEPAKRSFVKERKPKKEGFVLEVDLHIEKLVKNKRGMSNYDILTLQAETAKGQLDFAIRNRLPRVVFIHGVGEGVLKAELDFLFGRYEGVIVSDADYQKYGGGATEVYIKQNPNR